jgi:hypothetical protein
MKLISLKVTDWLTLFKKRKTPEHHVISNDGNGLLNFIYLLNGGTYP